MNRSDYERLAPPKSFIHVADFTSPTDLAKYLLHLQNNPGKKYHLYIYFDEYRKMDVISSNVAILAIQSFVSYCYLFNCIVMRVVDQYGKKADSE